MGGVKDIREAVAEAQEQARAGRRTILFVDEVHRFNKAQQDALLPWVENGTVVLIGATTENPYFEVNKALVSRSRVFQLKPLTEDDLRRVAAQALADPDRGYGAKRVHLEDDALDHLVGRRERRRPFAAERVGAGRRDDVPNADGVILITRAVAEESIQQRAVLYDKEGDVHFDTISAFIKSVRGSDPDAALYWLAKMVYAGEDPRFILRRLLILASEDVGLADPQALGVVAAAAQAYDYVGLPEGRYHLAQATLYLATAPKSNSTLGFFDALDAVGKEREGEVPNHLRDGNRDAEGFGHGAGYAYPHAYREHWVAQQYLPDALQAKVFYQPSGQGYEAGVKDEVARRREAQLAAMLEGEGRAPVEVLTNSPTDRARERWLERTVSSAGARLGRLRDAVFEVAAPQRHHLVLDVAAGSGLLVWEAVRRTPEGQVWAATDDPRHAAALRQQAGRLDALERPEVVDAAPDVVAAAVAARDGAIRFDRVVGRGVLGALADPRAWLADVAALLTHDGALVLAESDPRRAQRLAALVDWSDAADLGARVRDAEDRLYADPAVVGTAARVGSLAAAAGLSIASVRDLVVHGDQRIAAEGVERWFGTREAPGGTPRRSPPRSRPRSSSTWRAATGPASRTRWSRGARRSRSSAWSVPWPTEGAGQPRSRRP